MDQGSPEYEKEYDPQRTEFSFITLTTMEFLFDNTFKKKNDFGSFFNFFFLVFFCFLLFFSLFLAKNILVNCLEKFMKKEK